MRLHDYQGAWRKRKDSKPQWRRGSQDGAQSEMSHERFEVPIGMK